MNDDHITIRKIKPDDFRRGILSGEISPHDVEVTVRFKSGKSLSHLVKWADIVSLYEYHNRNAAGEYYEWLVDCSLSR